LCVGVLHALTLAVLRVGAVLASDVRTVLSIAVVVNDSPASEIATGTAAASPPRRVVTMGLWLERMAARQCMIVKILLAEFQVSNVVLKSLARVCRLLAHRCVRRDAPFWSLLDKSGYWPAWALNSSVEIDPSATLSLLYGVVAQSRLTRVDQGRARTWQWHRRSIQ
jgi:hypothetical protein